MGTIQLSDLFARRDQPRTRKGSYPPRPPLVFAVDGLYASTGVLSDVVTEAGFGADRPGNRENEGPKNRPTMHTQSRRQGRRPGPIHFCLKALSSHGWYGKHSFSYVPCFQPKMLLWE